jgi:hypothetical protein
MANIGQQAGLAGGRAGKYVRNCYLSYYLLKPLGIWHRALTHGPIPWDLISDQQLIHFLFTHFVKFSTLMVNGRKFCNSFLSNYL